MFRLIALLCAGAFVYNMGHNAAAAPADASAQQQPVAAVQPQAPQQQPSLWSAVAQTGGAWLARQVHEQTAWAADGSAPQQSQAQTVQVPTTETQAIQTPATETQPIAAQQAQLQAVGPQQPVRVAVRADQSAPTQAAATPHRLHIVYEPSLAATAAQLIH